jgi:circadian clock protein KaiB
MPKATRAKPELVLRLYIAGNAPNSLRATANARAVCEAHFAGRHTLEIVDMIQHPQRAAADGVIVTPTLLRLWPQPVRRVIGDLRDATQVLLTLASE